jgi:hypothetical protein
MPNSTFSPSRDIVPHCPAGQWSDRLGWRHRCRIAVGHVCHSVSHPRPSLGQTRSSVPHGA